MQLMGRRVEKIMANLVFQRVFHLVLLLIGISFLIFTSMHIAPGDPAHLIAGPSASESDVQAIRASLGLDKPFIIQYFDYLTGLVQGDLGYSYQSSRPVLDLIKTTFPNTLNLAIASIIVAIIIGVIAGIISAIRQNTWFDVSSTTVALIGISVPNFWLGTMLILFFSVKLQWLPVGGLSEPFYTVEGMKQLLLPAIALGTGPAAMIARMSRSAMLEVIRSDYIRTARAKGVNYFSVIMVHALRNAIIPVITVIGINFGSLLGGAIIIEKVFAINGVGRLMIDGIASRDFPVVQGTVLLVSTVFVLVNLITDLIYTVVDPRIEYN